MQVGYVEGVGALSFVADVDNAETFREDNKITINGRDVYWGLGKHFQLRELPSGTVIDELSRYKVNHDPFFICYVDPKEYTEEDFSGLLKGDLQARAAAYGFTTVNMKTQTKAEMVAAFVLEAQSYIVPQMYPIEDDEPTEEPA